MYSRIIQRKAEIAINRAFGKSVTAVLKDLIIEMTIYLILAFLLSGTIILFLTLSMPENYNNYNYFKYYFYSVAFTSTLSLISLSILFFVLKKISISDALKTKEE
ncbi:FtsX-like permease family protein [Bacillus paralicheniformis]